MNWDQACAIAYNIANPLLCKEPWFSLHIFITHLHCKASKTGDIIAQQLIPLLGYIAKTIPFSLPCILSYIKRQELGLSKSIHCSDLKNMGLYLKQMKTGCVFLFSQVV